MYQPLPLEIPPGIVTEDTPLGVRGRYIDGNFVRFWKGKPQRWGGWDYWLGSGSENDLGKPARGTVAWRALDGTRLTAWGTADKLWVTVNGVLYDITPEGLSAGLVDSLPNASSPAEHARTWTLYAWGEDLVACPRGGGIYHWDFTDGPETPAELISEAPSNVLAIFVTDERHLVALGADDPLRIAWANRETLDEWTPSATNTAGDLPVDRGTEIINAIPVRGGFLIVTDAAAYLFRYIGGTFVHSVERLDGSCDMIGPLAGVEVSGIAYWMGRHHLYTYDGILRAVPCDVHDRVFGAFGRNLDQRYKIVAGRNRQFNEAIFFYPDATSGENNRCFTFNSDGWALTALSRTSWLDDSVISAHPIACDASGRLFEHEKGTTNHTGRELSYFLETGDVAFDDPTVNGGQSIAHIRQVAPDFQRLTGTHELLITARRNPQGPGRIKGPYPYSESVGRFSVRAKGGLFRFQLSGAGDFRVGQPKVFVTNRGSR